MLSFQPGLSLERKNPDLHYSKENCEWILKSDQWHNTTRSAYAHLDGRTQTVGRWAHEWGVAWYIANQRL